MCHVDTSTEYTSGNGIRLNAVYVDTRYAYNKVYLPIHHLMQMFIVIYVFSFSWYFNVLHKALICCKTKPWARIFRHGYLDIWAEHFFWQVFYRHYYGKSQCVIGYTTFRNRSLYTSRKAYIRSIVLVILRITLFMWID